MNKLFNMTIFYDEKDKNIFWKSNKEILNNSHTIEITNYENKYSIENKFEIISLKRNIDSNDSYFVENTLDPYDDKYNYIKDITYTLPTTGNKDGDVRQGHTKRYYALWERNAYNIFDWNTQFKQFVNVIPENNSNKEITININTLLTSFMDIEDDEATGDYTIYNPRCDKIGNSAFAPIDNNNGFTLLFNRGILNNGSSTYQFQSGSGRAYSDGDMDYHFKYKSLSLSERYDIYNNKYKKYII